MKNEGKPERLPHPEHVFGGPKKAIFLPDFALLTHTLDVC